MTETNAERLRLLKTESECAEHAGVEYRVIRLQDFDYLIEQAEQGIEQRKWFSAQRKLVGARSEEIYRLREANERLLAGFDKITTMQEYDDAYDLACKMLEPPT